MLKPNYLINMKLYSRLLPAACSAFDDTKQIRVKYFTRKWINSRELDRE